MAVVPPVAAVAAGAVAARRHKILRKFEEAHADQPGRARTLAELGIDDDSHIASDMIRSGILVAVDGERYFLSAEGLARSNEKHKNFVITMLAFSAILILALVLIFCLR